MKAKQTSCPDFAASVPATRGLIAAPWTPASHLLCSTAQKRSVSSRRKTHTKPGSAIPLEPCAKTITSIHQTLPQLRNPSSGKAAVTVRVRLEVPKQYHCHREVVGGHSEFPRHEVMWANPFSVEALVLWDAGKFLVADDLA